MRWGPIPGDESIANEANSGPNSAIGANMTEINTSDTSPNYGITRDLMWFVPVQPRRKDDDDDDDDSNVDDHHSNVDDLMMPSTPTSNAEAVEKPSTDFPEALPNAAAVVESPLIRGAAAEEESEELAGASSEATAKSPTSPSFSSSSSPQAPSPLARERMLVSARLLFGVCDGLWRMRRSVLDPCLDRPSAAALSRLGTVVRSAESVAIAQAARVSRGRSMLDPSKLQQRQHDGEGGWEVVASEGSGGSGDQGGGDSFDGGATEDESGVNHNYYWRDYT